MLSCWNGALFICVLTPETRGGHRSARKGEQVRTQNSRASFDPEGKYWTAECEIRAKEQLLTQLL